MSYTKLNTASNLLDKFTLTDIRNSLLATLPIYKKLALDLIYDEDVPSKAVPWIALLDIYAIQTNRHGYFDCGNVLKDFEKEITKKLLSFKDHKSIKNFIIKLYTFEMERTARINLYIQENNCTVIEC